MDTLFRNYSRLLSAVNNQYHRYLYNQIDWENRLIGITGARGTGKTTLLLQHIKDNFPDTSKALYVSLDNIWFTKNSLLELVDRFQAYGGTHLFLDEVHRYPTWSVEIKNIYDSYPELYIVFTGSSILEIYKSNADLSRRAITYHLYGLSFREFLLFENMLEIAPLSLEDILQNHQTIAGNIASKLKVLPEFRKYLEHGYYPFYKESIKSYPIRLQNIVNTILENDLPAVESVEYVTIQKIKKMLMIISSLVPFSPNITKLSAEIEANRSNTLKYLGYLQKAGLIISYLSSQKGMSLMNKPDKIYLDNTNLLYALSDISVNEGNLRETFFANQVNVLHRLTTTKQGDFLADDRYTFEIGGPNKSFSQIKDLQDSFTVISDIETGHGNRIPLWLFGFLY
ncbi:ATP-binding protein [Bacteroides sp. 224]|uniref:ATP-binding protein n=1 Tax=Bacteroides sp. 224 TaxID=2302936 RepID=UPI0013D865C1|nr:AAA family ATPase [Bacteroides sp. 224]NDV64748.1 AAA family ATPase [Bacteroides sp. 224]